MKAVLGAILICAGFSIVSSADTVHRGIVQAQNSSASVLSLAFGPSLPDAMKATTSIDNLNPSRARGGELITVDFKTPKTVEQVKLSGYSLSGLGKVLIHNVQATTTSPQGDIVFALGDLFSFNQKASGLYNNYKGKILLANNNYVSTIVNRALKELQFQVEGFTNSDATLLVQITTAEAMNYYDFTVKRSGQIPNGNDNGNNGDSGDDNGSGPTGSYYSWGQGQDGYGHCYEYASNGGALNEGAPVPNNYCGGSSYRWSQGQDGYTHCYEYGGGYVLNEGAPVPNSYCGG